MTVISLSEVRRGNEKAVKYAIIKLRWNFYVVRWSSMFLPEAKPTGLVAVLSVRACRLAAGAIGWAADVTFDDQSDQL